MSVQNTRPLIIPPGTCFGPAPIKTERVEGAHVQAIVGVGPDAMAMVTIDADALTDFPDLFVDEGSLPLPGEIDFADFGTHTGRGAYTVYGMAVGFKNFRGDPMPEWEDLPEAIQKAWGSVAVVGLSAGAAEVFHEDPVAEDRSLRQKLDALLQVLKHPVSGRTSRERSLAVTKLQEAIMWLGMDLKALREEGHPSATESPYPDSYSPESDAPVAPTSDGLAL